MNEKELLEIINNNDECEWIEYKLNWFSKTELGEYISALSNSATENNQEYGYLIWGIQDKSNTIIGTTFKYDIDVDKEPLKHYLARNLNPSINFKFETLFINNKRIVVLTIPAAKRIITEFDKNRYIRIGSSKELLRKYPEREIDLAVTLKNGIPTIINTESINQDLKFNQIKEYYLMKGAYINNENFEENHYFYVPNTKRYNLLALLFSDNNDISCRVSMFLGKDKSTRQYSLNEFGKKSILLTIDQIIYFLESFNINKIDETNRIIERKDTPLFDSDCLREALLNAFIHNDWVELNSPMISIFNDRLEILSYGSLPYKQTINGFFEGKSKPRCKELAEIFLQLKISERSGRGVIKIVNKYGKDVFDINKDFIKVSIPFSYKRIFNQNNKKGITKKEKIMNKILNEMIENPNITTNDLMLLIGLKKTSIQKYIRILENENKIKRIGFRNGGYWEVLI